MHSTAAQNTQGLLSMEDLRQVTLSAASHLADYMEPQAVHELSCHGCMRGGYMGHLEAH